MVRYTLKEQRLIESIAYARRGLDEYRKAVEEFYNIDQGDFYELQDIPDEMDTIFQHIYAIEDVLDELEKKLEPFEIKYEKGLHRLDEWGTLDIKKWKKEQRRTLRKPIQF